MNRRFILFGVVLVFLGGFLSACGGKDDEESGMFGSTQSGVPSPTMSSSEVVGLGQLSVIDKFTVTVDSVEPFVDDTKSDSQSSDLGYEPPLYQVNFTVTYTGTEPITRKTVAFLIDDVKSLLGSPVSDDNNVPVVTGESFESSTDTFIDLGRESHAFDVGVWDEASEGYKVLGTIMLGPDNLS